MQLLTIHIKNKLPQRYKWIVRYSFNLMAVRFKNINANTIPTIYLELLEISFIPGNSNNRDWLPIVQLYYGSIYSWCSSDVQEILLYHNYTASNIIVPDCNCINQYYEWSLFLPVPQLHYNILMCFFIVV